MAAYQMPFELKYTDAAADLSPGDLDVHDLHDADANSRYNDCPQ